MSVSSAPCPWPRRVSERVGGKQRLWLGVVLLLVLAFVAAGLGACSRSDRASRSPKLSKRVVQIGEPVPKGGGRYKIGAPYQVEGRWYQPREDPYYDKVGVASWYGEMFHGRYTANGEIFDMDALTAAHPTLPMPTYAQVTNLRNGRSIVVRINDRGPYARNRVIDLSRRSAQVLGLYRDGTAPVRVRYLGRAPLNGDDSYERRVLASQPWARVALADSPKIYARAVAETIRERDAPKLPGTRSARVRVARADDAPVRAPERRPPVAADPAEPATATTARLPRPMRAAPREPLIFVQAGAFRRRENADAASRRLQGLGSVNVFPAEIAGEMWYRVRLGPFREEAPANDALRKVIAAGAVGARIVRN